MKFNTTYKPVIGLKDTIKILEYIKKSLSNFYHKKFKLIELDAPLFFEEDDENTIDFSQVTRDVTLDLGDTYQVAKIPLTHSNWLRNLIDRLELNDNEGLQIHEKYIWRDLVESPISTTVKNEITIQVKLKENQGQKLFLQEIVDELYSRFFQLAEDIAEKYNVKNIYPHSAAFITSQMLENEMINSSPKEREESFALDEEAFILSSAGKRMYSGKIHTFIPPQLYDLDNFHQIVFKDRVNMGVLKVASVAFLASGDTLKQQLFSYSLEELKAIDFYKKLIEQRKKILEIKINLPRLAMALLGKGHICEVQPGIISNESNIIKQRYKIEKY